MAFTDVEKAQIRRYLGYPDIYRDHTPWLESAMDVVGARTEVAAMVSADLVSLAIVETSLTSTLSSGGLKRIDDIEFYEGSQVASISHAGRRLVGRISVTLGIPICSDVFGGDGYMGGMRNVVALG